MPRALIIEFGACGVGCDAGPPRAYRLWLLQVAFERGGLTGRLSQQNRLMRRCQRLLWLIARKATRARITAGLTKEPASMTIDGEFMDELDGALREFPLEPGTEEDVSR